MQLTPKEMRKALLLNFNGKTTTRTTEDGDYTITVEADDIRVGSIRVTENCKSKQQRFTWLTSLTIISDVDKVDAITKEIDEKVEGMSAFSSRVGRGCTKDKG